MTSSFFSGLLTFPVMILLTFAPCLGCYFNFGSCLVCLWRLQKFIMEFDLFSFLGGDLAGFWNTFWIWSLIRYTLFLELEVDLVRIISGVCTQIHEFGMPS